MVNATHFMYDGVSSEEYGIQIAEFTGLTPESVEENEAFSPSLTTQQAPLSPRAFFGGVTYDTLPTCEFSVVSQDELTQKQRSEILSWLVGRNGFKPLVFDPSPFATVDREGNLVFESHAQVSQENATFDDPVYVSGESAVIPLSEYTYYCVFTGSSTIFVNGRCHGFKLTATFDSPFARGLPTVIGLQAGQNIVQIENKSDVPDDYVYPVVEFDGRAITIINLSDGGASRQFHFEGLQANEKTRVDCENKLITSNLGGEKLSNFTSKKWLRLKRGINKLYVWCVGDVTITCPNYAMIGY